MSHPHWTRQDRELRNSFLTFFFGKAKETPFAEQQGLVTAGQAISSPTCLLPVGIFKFPTTMSSSRVNTPQSAAQRQSTDVPYSQITTVFLWNFAGDVSSRPDRPVFTSERFLAHGRTWTLTCRQSTQERAAGANGTELHTTAGLYLYCSDPPSYNLYIRYTAFTMESLDGPDKIRSSGTVAFKPNLRLPNFRIPLNLTNPHRGPNSLILGFAIHSLRRVGVEYHPPQHIIIPPEHYRLNYLYQHRGVLSSIQNTDITTAPPFSQFFNHDQLSDVKFSVGGRTIPAHKLVLHTPSAGPYFAAVFSHAMQEQTTGTVEIKDVSFASFYEVLRYIYTGYARLSLDLLDMVEFYR